MVSRMSEVDVSKFVALAQGDDLRGGTIQVTRDPTDALPGKVLFAQRLPLAASKLSHYEEEIGAAIDLDWRSSGRKAPRSYTLAIYKAGNVLDTQRAIALDPEPTNPQDVISGHAAITLVTLNDAAATIKQPFDQLKDVIAEQRREVFEPQRELLTFYKEELVEARGRIKLLEGQLAERTDELREHKGKHADADLRAAEAQKARAEGSAALVVANAEAKAIDQFTRAGVDALPKLAGLAVKALGGKKLGAMFDTAMGDGPTAPGAPPGTPARKVDIVLQKAKAFAPELAAKIRALTLTDLELARLLMLVWMLDPEGDALELLSEETSGELFGLLPAVHAHLTGKAAT